ncbi:hypothetical protein T4D_2431 [Trichinella pseudospiralis]|uniref:Uncharacterized protein n=1 Tax=Trichinella pseudospiralis TaxID=6337 RepID=A0A0V1FNE8_TRIPS|nr:hypothetical protein T4D_2431 [Trichinella pseudospiralis]
MISAGCSTWPFLVIGQTHPTCLIRPIETPTWLAIPNITGDWNRILQAFPVQSSGPQANGSAV